MESIYVVVVFDILEYVIGIGCEVNFIFEIIFIYFFFGIVVEVVVRCFVGVKDFDDGFVSVRLLRCYVKVGV